MKKIVSSLAIIGMFTFGFSTVSFADEQDPANVSQEGVEAVMGEDTSVVNEVAEAPAQTEIEEQVEEAEVETEVGFVSTLKKKFIEGDPFWMGIVLVALIIGIALGVERILYLTFLRSIQRSS